MLIRTGLRAAIPAGLLAVCLVGCTRADTGEGLGGDVPYVDPSVAAAAADKASRMPEPSPTLIIQGDPNAPQLVRDAFAGLQATYQDGCAPGDGNCAYFLGRVNDELSRLDKAMKADKKGPGHFEEPIAWVGTLRSTLDGDVSTPNLEKHRTELLGTRDRIDTWMQGHPEDYR
ncbi:hypothetical protein ACFWVP_21665 [Streptomyces sp. NPDC058637]|uniref:hypothetical protein n=1 Tax=Streptomyces sp. NPDC058637 TaxID=3346569 RepID=UPI00365630EF